jgi:hypothetical protein
MNIYFYIQKQMAETKLMREGERFPLNNPMCYVASNQMFDVMVEDRPTQTTTSKAPTIPKASLKHLYKCTSSITVIELNITAPPLTPNKRNALVRKYGIINGFWVPRTFNHSFNILITKDRVIIAQSWFKVMNYQVIYRLTHKKFIKWLNAFRAAVASYRTNPKKLFEIFKYQEHCKYGKDIKNMFRYLKDTPMKVELLSKHAVC